MNKKLAAALLSTTMLAGTALADNAKGFFLGADVGVQHTQFDERFFGANGTDVHGRLQHSRTTSGGVFKAHFGYQTPVQENYFASAEVFVGPGSCNYKATGLQVVDTTDPAAIERTHSEVELKLQSKMTYGAAFKFGRYIDTRSAVYFDLSLGANKVKASYVDDGGNSGEDKKTVLSVAPGAGYLYQLTDCDLLKVGYRYKMYAKWHTKDLDADEDNVLNIKSRMNAHTFSISYSRVL